MATSKKFKYWIAVSYPYDSEPADCFELAKAEGVECCSIIHDRDYNESETTTDGNEQGTAKKLHRHWIFAFPNSTTEKHASDVILKITNGLTPKGCSNVKGAYAYLTHKHDPDKAQYDTKDIECLNGFAPENYFTQNSGEEDEAFKCIEGIIKEQDLEEYCDLIDFLNANYADLARFARTHTLHLKAYLQSKHMKRRQKDKDRLLALQIAEYERRAAVYADEKSFTIDPTTGEVLD